MSRDNLYKERKSLQSKCDELNMEKAEGAKIRGTWIKQGEQNTSNFPKLEKQRQLGKRIDCLTDHQSKTLLNDHDILEEAGLF